MQVSYRILNSWRELDNLPEAINFMAYQVRTGQVVALDYNAMRKLFLLSNKAQIIKANVELLSALGQALEAGNTAGAVTITEH